MASAAVCKRKSERKTDLFATEMRRFCRILIYDPYASFSLTDRLQMLTFEGYAGTASPLFGDRGPGSSREVNRPGEYDSEREVCA
jgi:hypothetical protein